MHPRRRPPAFGRVQARVLRCLGPAAGHWRNGVASHVSKPTWPGRDLLPRLGRPAVGRQRLAVHRDSRGGRYLASPLCGTPRRVRVWRHVHLLRGGGSGAIGGAGRLRFVRCAESQADGLQALGGGQSARFCHRGGVAAYLAGRRGPQAHACTSGLASRSTGVSIPGASSSSLRCRDYPSTMAAIVPLPNGCATGAGRSRARFWASRCARRRNWSASMTWIAASTSRRTKRPPPGFGILRNVCGRLASSRIESGPRTFGPGCLPCSRNVSGPLVQAMYKHVQALYLRVVCHRCRRQRSPPQRWLMECKPAGRRR